MVDKGGNAYYTDLRNVWRLTPSGATSIVVRDVHTHELYLDRGDTLYGEHLWYDGAIWRHRVWRRTPDGAIEDVIRTRTGFRDDYDDFHFARDTAGAMYWREDDAPSARNVIRTRRGAGAPSTVASSPRGHVGWLAVSATGNVYFVSHGDLYRASRGRAVVVARGISEHSAVPLFVRFVGWASGFFRKTNPDHDVGGLWLDANENVYAAVPGGGVVKRISPSGEVRVISRSAAGWTAVGGTSVGTQIWLLENGPGDSTRVRRAPL